MNDLRIGTVCYLTRLAATPQYNGRVCEVMGAQCIVDGDKQYPVTSDWIRDEFAGCQCYARREFLIPLAGPDASLGMPTHSTRDADADLVRNVHLAMDAIEEADLQMFCDLFAEGLLREG